MLDLVHVQKIYNPGLITEVCLFEDFNLHVEQGQFVSVVGSNGSGKTSMLNIICGSIPISKGQVLSNGADVTRQPEYRRYARMGRVYQNPALGTCGELTLLENLSLAETKGQHCGLQTAIRRSRIEDYRAMLATLLRTPRYWFGVVAQFFYVGVQIAAWTWLNVYCQKELGVTPA